MIAPSYWVDPRSGNDYLLTVQYPENRIRNLMDLSAIPLHASRAVNPARLDAPTEVDHYQLRRVIDVYVGLDSEDLGRIANRIDEIVAGAEIPAGLRVDLRGMVQGMRASMNSFGRGLILSVVLLYLILVAQFRSFVDPLLILLAVPPGLAGVSVTLPFLNGGLFKARQREAEARAGQSQRRVQVLENAVAREVAVALLDVTTAKQRIEVTGQWIAQAAQALELAQSRYELGLSSIVELSQAQLARTNAEIQQATARYDYQLRLAILDSRTGRLQ